ncbi:MAG: hypothetical protein KDK91_15600 [Gammaproteobacteria bacterium]|nr:hypothetical protein [Gammaproteobacteria bacterium]
MDTYEKIGYACLGAVVVAYIMAMLIGLIVFLPFGLLGLLALLGIGVLLLKVIRERLANKEDDYYARNVKR